RAEAARLGAKGNESYERAVSEGHAEQERSVSESAVARRANEEANRIIASAHTESNRLRTARDERVDSKLGECDESLTGILRTINADRAALRRGAGASGHRAARGGYSSYERE